MRWLSTYAARTLATARLRPPSLPRSALPDLTAYLLPDPLASPQAADKTNPASLFPIHRNILAIFRLGRAVARWRTQHAEWTSLRFTDPLPEHGYKRQTAVLGGNIGHARSKL